jgi:class 3 adenylate cyclase
VVSGYASSGDRHIAYRVDGTGPDLLGLAGTLFSVDVLAEQPRAESYYRRLAAFCRLIRYDYRGVGRSDPVDVGVRLSVDAMVDDALSVLDTLEVDRATVMSEGGVFTHIAFRLAAKSPDRVASLVLVNPTARVVEAEGYVQGHPVARVEGYIDENIDPAREWVHPEVEQDEIALMVPSLKDDLAFRDWWVSAAQRSASPATAKTILSALMMSDSRSLLETLNVPTLVLHRRAGEMVPITQGRFVADHIPGARMIELPVADDVVWAIGADTVVDHVEDFMTGRRSGRSERVVLTVLFTDIVDSTRTAAALGDREWRARLETHDSIVRRELARFDGHEVNTTGDGFLATFDSPTQAVRAADAIGRAAQRAGVDVRTGMHTGECERRGNDLMGVAVHLASRVAAKAGAREVLVSRTVRDLVAGSGIRFVDRGEYELKGIPERIQLFALEE